MNIVLQELNTFGKALAQLEADHRTLEGKVIVKAHVEDDDEARERELAQEATNQARDDIRMSEIAGFSKGLYIVSAILLALAAIF